MIDRLDAAVENNLGTVRARDGYNAFPTYRSDYIKKLRLHYENRQFKDKTKWSDAQRMASYVPIRERSPDLVYPLPRICTDRIQSKLAGRDTFPKFKIENDEDTQELIRVLHEATEFRVHMQSAFRHLISMGSAFTRIKILGGVIGLQCYHPNHCWPIFGDDGQLESIEIRYIFQKQLDNGEWKEYWYRLKMNKTTDTLYDNPEYAPGGKPKFKVVEKVDHDLGFVQGEWVKFTKDMHRLDGDSVFKDVLEFGNSLSYIFTMQESGVEYGIDPQLVLKGVDNDEIDNLIKSKEHRWSLGPEGEANYLETSGNGITVGMDFSDDLDKKIQQATRIIMHDPEKFSAHAQSGKAMEILHGPMVELVSEYRPYCEKFMTSLSLKMMASVVLMTKRGMLMDIGIPDNWKPTSLDLKAEWPPVFPLTVSDEVEVINKWRTLTDANIVSRRTALEKMAQLLQIEDIDAEVRLVETQKEFGGFF